MLPKENRLTRLRDYEILFAEGIFVGAKHLTAKVWKIDLTKYPRRKYLVEDLKIGFLVSKKVSKRAVDRNRIKRQMREVVRLLLKDNKLKTGFMLAFMAKPGTVGLEYAAFETDILFILRRARLL